MVTLHQVPGAWGLSSLSPFCVKLETWLRIAGIPYEVAADGNPAKAPKGKVPFVVHDGATIGDSHLIQQHLTRAFGVTLDDHLSPEERARGHAAQRMLEEGTYWVCVHDRWVSEAGWAHYRPAFLKILPPGIGGLILPFIRSGLKKSLHAQGTGRHTPEEIDAMGAADADALAALLGDRPFFLGDAPTSVDATVYAFVSGVLGFPGESRTKAAMAAHANLVAYRARMEARYWPSQSTS